MPETAQLMAAERSPSEMSLMRAPASLGGQPAARTAPSPTPQPGPAPDLAQKLTELGKLHSEGVLTEAEFTAAKKRLLGGS